MNNKLQSVFFSATSRLTDMFPEFGGHLLDSAIRPTYGSRTLSALFEHENCRVMRSVKAFRRFLVVPDIHIGDSVMMQSALSAVRDFFPAAEIDYVVNKTAAPLIEGNPESTNVIPVYSNGLFPSPGEIGKLHELLLRGHYDLCLNICPFLEKRDITDADQPVARFLNHAPTLIRNENDFTEINHFSYQVYRFVRGIFSSVAHPVRGDHFKGVRTTYSDESVALAWEYVRECSLPPGSRVIMFNPDSSVIYNLMPFESQAKFLEILARDTGDDISILLGEGHTESGIGLRLAETVPRSSGGRSVLFPGACRSRHTRPSSTSPTSSFRGIPDRSTWRRRGGIHARATVNSETKPRSSPFSVQQCPACRATIHSRKATFRPTRTPRRGATSQTAVAGTSHVSTRCSRPAGPSGASNTSICRNWKLMCCHTLQGFPGRIPRGADRFNPGLEFPAGPPC